MAIVASITVVWIASIAIHSYYSLLIAIICHTAIIAMLAANMYISIYIYIYL